MDIIHIEPYYYCHIKNKIDNIISLVEGPCSYILQSHEEKIAGPFLMITILPCHFMIVSNPVVVNDLKEIVYEEGYHQPKMRYGCEEIRTHETHPDPFPLYPGEVKSEINYNYVLNENEGLKLKAKRPFKEGDIMRKAGDEWVIKGPMAFIPQVEVDILGKIDAVIISINQILKLEAMMEFTDASGVKRVTGEQYFIKEQGPYIPCAEEKLIKLVDAILLNDMIAVHLEATFDFVDVYGIQRKAGQNWLVTSEMSASHFPDIFEKVIKTQKRIILNKWQFCYIINPIDEKGANQYGKKILKRGETSFFLQPNEVLEKNSVFDNIILSDEEALLLLALEEFTDDSGENHKPGERWMVYGPTNYVPSIEVSVIEKRSVIPLDDIEGIYVRDIHSGEVKMITGETYLLKSHEELWEKPVPDIVETLLQTEGVFDINQAKPKLAPRDKSRVIAFNVPHNAVTQIFDYKDKENRIEFGPTKVKLGPYDEFTILSLSGGNPKKEDQVKSLILRLGPDFISDIIDVETSDHARLLLDLSFSWQFSIDKENPGKLFSIKDYVGDCTKSIASRIRGIVSGVTFDSFHKDSANIVQSGVFGKDKDGKLKKPFEFKPNGLRITNVDVQSQELVDTKTREILNKSMILSMKTNLSIQELDAKHREAKDNQEAIGKIERKKLEDDTEIETKRLNLLQLVADNNQIEITGLAEADTKPKCIKNEIQAEAELEKTKSNFEALKTKKMAELDRLKKEYDEELRHMKRMKELEVINEETLSNSSVSKLKIMVDALGKEAIIALAKSGAETQKKLLQSLGVKSLLVTDGKNPINLFNTASGLISTNMIKP